MLENLSLGKEIQVGKSKIKIVSGLFKLKEYYAIYADIIENHDFKSPCSVYKLDNEVALIIRDKEKLLQMGLNSEERKTLYCHELGHCFSENQQGKNFNKRDIDMEVDSDSFAVEKCGMSPYVLESALAKTYSYDIKNISNVTKERIDRYVKEMTARKRNVEKLIKEMEEKNKMEL